jgi:DNA-binding transcriptional LysR family regulator
MDFTALRYFSETARAQSIRAASERLHVSPSAISRQIAKIEHELRAHIFDRRSKGMVLTPAGEMLAARFDLMMREFDRVKSHIASLQNLQAGTVDLYCFQTAIESIIAPVINRFTLQYPNVLFNVRMSSTDEAIEALLDGTAEISLIVNPPVRDTIESLVLYRDAIVAALAPNHPLSKRKTVRLRELAEFPFVLTETSFGLRQQIDKVLDRQGIQPQISCVTNSLNLLKAVASIGTQCTLLPRSAVQCEAAAGSLTTIAVHEFASNPMVFCISTLSGRSVSPAAKTFAQAVIDYCRRYHQ